MITDERLQKLLKFYSDSPITWETRDIIQELINLRKEKVELIDDAEFWYHIVQYHEISDSPIITEKTRKHNTLIQEIK